MLRVDPETPVKEILDWYFPGEDDGVLDYLVWTFTGYPCCFVNGVQSFVEQLAWIRWCMDTCTPILDPWEMGENRAWVWLL